MASGRYALRIVEAANPFYTPVVAGLYVASYDPDAPGDQACVLTLTHDISQAKAFPSRHTALEEWRRVRTVDSVRPDGKPNRPLTAFTVTVEKIPDAPVGSAP